ncbi:tRNA lysidine(34) synthetase TilS [Aestuariivirga litoralis]|uniref:tRNA lysidine(34) synthetase TilS n=1 Tax=Aestuariivirga litoralis TaxID=2650924 RepID=UPI0018C4FB70
MKAAPSNFSAARLKRLFRPCAPFPSLAIAVSGGGDSIALLRLAHAWHGSGSLIALTVDHGLRKESVKEAKQVASCCKSLGIKHHVLKWKHQGITSGLQAKARSARYELMAAWCGKHGVNALLTAHTMDDQAETVAMRQRRTSSAKSLSAIWPEKQWNGITVLRPLLDVTRAELRDYLTAIGQDWIEDPSNQDHRYERVRVRAEAPALTLAAEAKAAQRKTRSAEKSAAVWIAKSVTVTSFGMITISSASVKAMTDAALLNLIALAGGSTPELAKRESLAAWLASDETGRRTLGGALFAKRQREIIVAREPARIAAAPVATSPANGVRWDNRFLVIGPKGSSIIARAALKSLKRNGKIPAFVDAGLPVVMRGDKVLADVFSSHHPEAKITFITK